MWTQTITHGEHYVKTKAKIGVMHLSAKVRPGTDPSFTTLKRKKPDDTLISHFLHLQMWDKILLLIKPPRLWFFVIAVQEN